MSPASASTRCGRRSSSIRAPTRGSTPVAWARWASVPAAMGAKVAATDRTVWAIDGDGCFQMTNQELATCVINDIPIKVAVINNAASAWCASGRRCSTTSATPTPTCTPPQLSGPRLRQARRRLWLRRPVGRAPEDVDASSRRRCPSTTAGRHRLRRPPRRDGVADGACRRQQRRHPGRHARGPCGIARSPRRSNRTPTPTTTVAENGRGTTMSTHLSVLVENKPGPGPDRQPVLPRGLQHRSASPSARPSTPTFRG